MQRKENRNGWKWILYRFEETRYVTLYLLMFLSFAIIDICYCLWRIAILRHFKKYNTNTKWTLEFLNKSISFKIIYLIRNHMKIKISILLDYSKICSKATTILHILWRTNCFYQIQNVGSIDFVIWIPFLNFLHDSKCIGQKQILLSRSINNSTSWSYIYFSLS